MTHEERAKAIAALRARQCQLPDEATIGLVASLQRSIAELRGKIAGVDEPFTTLACGRLVLVKSSDHGDGVFRCCERESGHTGEHKTTCLGNVVEWVDGDVAYLPEG
jgi:hypothetical protein